MMSTLCGISRDIYLSKRRTVMIRMLFMTKFIRHKSTPIIELLIEYIAEHRDLLSC